MVTLGAFEIGRVLGSGGSGTVYAARSAQTQGVEIALKVLREDAALTPRERARFMDEAARMRRVSHPALVSMLDAGFLPDGRPYVAMPLLAGESLAERLTRGRLPLPEVRAIFSDLAGAVATLHAAGLVHRDIKPENVMVTERDGRLAGTLLDLGIARDVAAPASTTTNLGNVRGTPAYMALERFFGTPASIQSDVYELTVTLYMMLTGTLPWRRAEDATERMTPMHPSQAGVALPEPLTHVLMRGLAAKPEARFQSADELARAIAAALPLTLEGASLPAPWAPTPQSSPHAFESTTLAPHLPPQQRYSGPLGAAAGSMGPPPQTTTNGGGGAALIAGGLFAGLVLVGAMIAGAVWLTRTRAPGPTVVTVMPSSPPPPTSSADEKPVPPPATAAPSASEARPPPTRPKPSAAAPSAKPSATPADPDDLRFCEALAGIYCGIDYERLHGKAPCASYSLTLVEYHKLPPDQRAQRENGCIATRMIVMKEIETQKKRDGR